MIDKGVFIILLFWKSYYAATNQYIRHLFLKAYTTIYILYV